MTHHINLDAEYLSRQLREETEKRHTAEQHLQQAEKQIQQLQEQLREAAQHKSEFLSSMNHELRTPLNAMIGYTSLAINALQETVAPEYIENLVNAERSARQLLQLINDILDFSKIEAGKVEMFLEPVEMDEIIEDVIFAAEHMRLDKPVEVQYDIAPNLVSVESDYAKIKQILENLVDNAIKFTAEGYVRIRAMTSEEERTIRIEVQDSGTGIPEEKIGSIFELFKQVDGSTKKKFRGTGLGLAITKSYCDMLHIEIGVQSTVEQGTLFWLEIPIRMPSEKKARAVPLPKQPFVWQETLQSVTSKPLLTSVLIVDDDEMNLNLHQQIFQKADVTVYLAHSGRECLEIARQKVPDLILMDLGMPGMDGFETTQALKENADTSPIPVIACSAFTNRELQEKAASVGCQGYITKPIDPLTLVAQVTNILSTSGEHE